MEFLSDGTVKGLKEDVLAQVTTECGEELSKQLSKAIDACIKNEKGSVGMYAEAYWRIFCRFDTTSEVIRSFEYRLAYVNPIK